MIDWKAFIDALDGENFTAIAMAVHERKEYEAEEAAENLVLSFPEVDLIRAGHRHEAMIRIHKRLGCGILVARSAVERQLLADHEPEVVDEIMEGEDWDDDEREYDDAWNDDGGQVHLKNFVD